MSSRLKKRSTFLAETVLLISRISLEIEYTNLPLFEILKKIESGSGCESLDFISLCLDKWKNGEDFSRSWKEGVVFSQLPLKKEEKQCLENLGSMLGTSDAAGQMSILALYKSYFSSFHSKAAQDYEKYGKMCITLGVVTGMGILILLM